MDEGETGASQTAAHCASLGEADRPPVFSSGGGERQIQNERDIYLVGKIVSSNPFILRVSKNVQRTQHSYSLVFCLGHPGLLGPFRSMFRSFLTPHGDPDRTKCLLDLKPGRN